LPLAISAAVVRLDERQLSGLAGTLASLALPKRSALKVEKIPTKLNVPGSMRVRLLYGPYKLKAANSTVKVGNGMSMDRGGTSYSWMVDDDFPRDITTLEVSAELQDEKFQRTDTKDGIYNHHIVFMDLSPSPAPAFACEGRAAKMTSPSVYIAGATEVGNMRFAATKGDIKSGYYLTKDRKVTNMIDVINYNNVERTVYVSAEIEYIPGKAPGYLDARQERVDPGMCGGPNGAAIHPPKGVSKFSVNSTGIVVARDGYLVNIRGHVHDGGIDILLKVNGKEVCDSTAAYGGEGHTGKTADGRIWETIRTTSTCEDPIKVVKGDKLYMEAHYDVGLHPSREQGAHGGMGMRRFPNLETISVDAGEAAEQMALVVTHFAYTS